MSGAAAVSDRSSSALRSLVDAQAPGVVLRCVEGLPHEAGEGAALSAYAWAGGELVRIVEADGRRFDYRYGDDGRLVAVDRDGKPWARYAYDEAGRLCVVDRPDGPLAHRYDNEGRLVQTRRGDASAASWRWHDGRVVEARSDDESSRFDYDGAGRLVGIEQRVAGRTLALRFDFDAAGRLAGIEFAPWQQRIGFEWDARGRPAALRWNGRVIARSGTDDAQRLSWVEGLDGVRRETEHDRAGRPLRQRLTRNGELLHDLVIERDDGFRVVREGSREHAYDAQGRLVQTRDGDSIWRWRHLADGTVVADDEDAHLTTDAEGRVQMVWRDGSERVYCHNQAGELESLRRDGECAARCRYDHKGRLVWKSGAGGCERYLYGADDSLLAVADGEGRPKWIWLRDPTGLVGAIDFRHDPRGEALVLHRDPFGNVIAIGRVDGSLHRCAGFDPWGLPLGEAASLLPPIWRGRLWHADIGAYAFGARWYDPRLKRFLTPDTHTGAPDDARLVNPFVPAAQQRFARAGVLADWLRQPRLRQRVAYCLGDPVNRFDANGHWSFGGVLLSVLGALWTLPNTAFGLAVEVSCLIGEVVRWLVYAFSLGHASWQTPGFDVAASGRLNAFALVFKGGWLGSFQSLLGITFGNVIFVNGEYEQHAEFQALPDPVTPPAYGGSVTVPKAQALYEHELRHVNQYGWWGPFFHLGLPLFGIYEWDVILNGYQNASLEKDAREHAGF